MFEEGAFSLLSRDGLGQVEALVCSIFDFLFSTMTWRLTSVSFRKFSYVIPFNRRLNELQCLNYVNNIDHSVFVLTQFKNKSFAVL